MVHYNNNNNNCIHGTYNTHNITVHAVEPRTTRATNPRHSARRAWSHWAGGGARPVSGAPCVETRYSGPDGSAADRGEPVLLLQHAVEPVRRPDWPEGWCYHRAGSGSIVVTRRRRQRPPPFPFSSADAPRTRARTCAHHSIRTRTHCTVAAVAASLRLSRSALVSLVPIGRYVVFSLLYLPRSFGRHCILSLNKYCTKIYYPYYNITLHYS